MRRFIRSKARGLVALISGALIAANPVAATDYYAGKTIEMLIGADVAGGYDIYARAVARRLGAHIPGNPQIVARNMPGAGSALAGAHLFRVAPKDGATIGALMPGAIMGRLLDERASTLFEPTKFNYIGTADSGTRVCITYGSSPTKTYEDALNRKTIMGASQAGGATRDYEALHNHATGTKFEVISGYKGTSDILLAMERGEAAGLCGFDYSSLKSQKSDWLRDRKVNIIMQDGLDPLPELTAMGVPQIWPFIHDELDRKAVELILSQQLFGRSYVVPPGTPEDVVAILRAAFAATMRDPEFLADADKLRIGITPSSGEKLQEVVSRVHASSADVIERAKRVIEP
jgi:tripartite-type tricarboxylate transporter receptor subunit TctC